MLKKINHYKNSLMTVLSVSLQAQISIAIGILFSLIVSYFYFFLDDPRFPQEKPEVLWAGFISSIIFFILGKLIAKYYFDDKLQKIGIKQGMQIVLFTWVFAIFSSSLIFFLAGFPIPDSTNDFSLFRRITDSLFESMSGFTTAGGSILPGIEVFPRGVLMWRSTTHVLGGMGLAYASIILIKKLITKRESIVNSEVESPNFMDFENDDEIIKSGYNFAKTYFFLIVSLMVLLFISGSFFRINQYETWHDNLFDSVNYAFSTMGTGGFGIYDTSAGLPMQTVDGTVIGGLQNPTSEWIIALFMMIAGTNFGLWYILFFDRKNLKSFFSNKELWAYIIFVLGLTFSIWGILMHQGWAGSEYYDGWFNVLRYSFFNVNTIVSTTGLGNTNFHLWPAAALAVLFIPYFTGGMAGSTSGGLKTLRFMVFFRYSWMKIQNLMYGRYRTRFTIDGIKYDSKQAGFILVNILLYLIIFLGGSVMIMVLSPQVTFVDGSTKDIDLISGITASISNLGNIGPTTTLGSVDSGPSGNYSAYSEGAKIVMVVLMLIGRIGVLSFLMLFITSAGMKQVENVVAEKHFDQDDFALKG